MKKLIAVLVVFALVAGTVFAQASIGGNVQMGTYLLQGDSMEDSHLTAGPLQMANVHANVTAGDSDAGAMLRLYSKMNDWQPTFFAYIWWKPADWFRLQLGQQADGDWGHAQITGWGFNGEAQQKVALDGDNRMGPGATVARKTVAWAPGISTLAMNVSITPAELVPGLSFNVSVPFAEGADVGTNGSPPPEVLLGKVYTHMYLNLSYYILDIGTIRLSSQLAPGYKKGDKDKWYGDNGLTDPTDTTKLWLAFQLIAIDNLGAEVGFGYQLPFKNDETDYTRNHQLGVGLGLTYRAGDFNAKLRFGMNAAGSEERDGVVSKSPMMMGVNILPSYNLPFMTIFFNAGMGFSVPEEGDTDVDWFINPYIRKDVGGVRFYAGIQIRGDSRDKDPDEKAIIKFAVPIGLQYYF